MNQIAKPSKIDPTRIDPRHYFESLVQQAAQCGLLAEREIHRIPIFSTLPEMKFRIRFRMMI